MSALRIPALAALVAAFVASGALAQTSAPTARQAPGKDKMICKRDNSTGQLVPKKTCKTESEWRAQAEAASRAGQAMMDKGAITSCGSSSPGGCGGGI